MNEAYEEYKEKSFDFHSMAKAQLELINLLMYLRISGRYKQNKRYRHATFKEFLFNMYGIADSRFDKWSAALIHHPEEVEKYGVDVVCKIQDIFRKAECKRVFNKIEEAEQRSKDKTLSWPEIDNIIYKEKLRKEIKKEIELETESK